MSGGRHGEGRRGEGRGPLFHPFELAVCGHSGSGKTTLLERLVRRLAPTRRVGYVKRDVHGFQMDHEGKDTWRLREAGACALQIQSGEAWAGGLTGGAAPALSRQLFAACDLVLLEGYRREPRLDKLVFLEGCEPTEQPLRVAGLLTKESGRVDQALPAAWAAALPAGEAPPLFHRDDVAGIADWLLERFTARLAARPLRGLVLAGGHSRRMGRDKALLEYDGVPQVERAARLLESCCQTVHISARAGQGREMLGRPLIEDRFVEMGPVGGILSALEADPEAAWLVLGCDLPFVTPELLDALLAGRDPWRVATVFRDPASGLPEPLCAVWEPRSRALLLGNLAAETRCPRRALDHKGALLLDLPDPRALENVNRPEELEAARLRWREDR
jgi:molybdopterin-guanine dinucleotide biosynthesis protein MobB